MVEAKGQWGGGEGVQGRWARIPLSYDLGQTWVGREEEHLGKELDFSKPASRLEMGHLDNSKCNGKGLKQAGERTGVYFKVVEVEWSREGSGGSAGEPEGVWRCCSYRQALHGAGFWGERGSREEFPIQLMRLERPAGSWH